jgi:hypothetical protein
VTGLEVIDAMGIPGHGLVDEQLVKGAKEDCGDQITTDRLPHPWNDSRAMHGGNLPDMQLKIEVSVTNDRLTPKPRA